MFRDAYAREKKETIFYREHHRTTPLDHGTGGYHEGREESCIFRSKFKTKTSFFVILENVFFRKTEKPVLLRETILRYFAKTPLSLGFLF